MAKNSAINLDVTPNADGYSIAGGTTPRTLTITSGNVTLSAGGSNTYTLPAATGTLVSRDSTDTLTNKTIAGSTNSVSYNTFTNPYKFLVYRNAAQNSGISAFAKINFDTEVYDTGNNYDPTTNFRFTAPVNGFYRFDAACGTGTSLTFFIISLYKNGSEYMRGDKVSATSAFGADVGVGADIQLNATDYIEVFCFGNTGLPLDTGLTFTRFSGHLISVT